MPDDIIYICYHCGYSNNNKWCPCGSGDMQTISSNDDYYYNDDPTNYTNDELDKYDEK